MCVYSIKNIKMYIPSLVEYDTVYKMPDVEVPSLYGIAIVAVILGAIAIILVIININISDENLNIPPGCQESCGDLEDITRNNDCWIDNKKDCTFYRIVNATDEKGNPIGTFKTGPSQVSYLTACNGTCQGTVSMVDNVPVCNSTDCKNDPDSSCSYNRCIQTYKPLPQCKNDLARPVGCANNTIYYLQSTINVLNDTCVCSNS